MDGCELLQIVRRKAMRWFKKYDRVFLLLLSR